jgi:hypothetical protein
MPICGAPWRLAFTPLLKCKHNLLFIGRASFLGFKPSRFSRSPILNLVVPSEAF